MKIEHFQSMVKKSRGKTNRFGPARQAKPDTSNNPFDRFSSRPKHNVLGRKIKGVQKSLNAAKSKAIQQRQSSLLTEFKKHEANQHNDFIDKRFGEKDIELSDEQKVLKRFERQRMKQIKIRTGSTKSSKFNLNEQDDEEELTHMGQTLGEFDESDDELSASPMDVFKKSPNAPRTKKEIMSEVISKSKYHKVLKQNEKDEQEKLLLDIDDQFDSMRGLMQQISENAVHNDEGEDEDAYDMQARKLLFDSRMKAEERTKTEEETALEELKKLEELEKERVKRMNAPMDDLTEEKDDGMEEPEIDPEFMLESSDDEIELDGEIEQEIDHVVPSIKDETNSGLPYVFKMPEELEDLVFLLENRSVDEKMLVIDRIRKCHHVSLSPFNKQKLQHFTSLLIEYMVKLTQEDSLNELVGIVSVMSQMFSEQPVASIAMVKQQIARIHVGLNCQKFPSTFQLTELAVYQSIFPSTDFDHPVTTAVNSVLSHAIARTPLKSQDDLRLGLIACEVLIGGVEDSGKYFAPVFQFLCSALVKILGIEEPAVISLMKKRYTGLLLWQFDASTVKNSEVIEKTLNCCRSAIDTVKDNICAKEILSPLLSVLKKCPSSDIIQDLMNTIENVSAANVSQRLPVIMKKIVHSIKELEPVFDEDFTPDRANNKSEIKQLKRKLKFEQKGARKELRKDTRFVANEKRKMETVRSAEKEAKYKEILHFLEEQARDTNALSKMGKRAKRAFHAKK